MLKRLLFATYQALVFLIEVLRGRAELKLEVVDTGWPDSRWKSRFLIIGYRDVTQNQIFMRVGGTLYPLESCPQKEFFRSLKLGLELESNYYYSVARRELGEEELTSWIQQKTKLMSDYTSTPWQFSAIVVRKSKDCLIVEDGAHRLALSNLNGTPIHKVGVSLWSWRRN